MGLFKLHSDYKPTGDQPEAIDKLVNNIKNGVKEQTLLGATGTGKTFTIANVIERIGKKTLVLAHNKTLAGQLYSELKGFFRKTESNISFLTMIITSLKRMSPTGIYTSKRTPASTTTLTRCGTAP